jgi:hypothetical protein
MTKRITRFDDYISASDAARLLSLRTGRFIDPEYMTKLAKSKKQPIRTQQVSNRLLYNRDDVLACTVKQKQR